MIPNRQKARNETILERWASHDKIEIGRIFVLADMAKNRVYPDASFSDDECCVWLAFMELVDEIGSKYP